VAAHNRQDAPRGQLLDPSKLNFPHEWDTGSPVVQRRPGGCGPTLMRHAGTLGSALILWLDSELAAQVHLLLQPAPRPVTTGARPRCGSQAAGQPRSRALALRRPVAFAA
jgi:hypothetical protein